MRLTGFVNVDGKRVALDWRINGVSVSSGPGLSADDVRVHTMLPDLALSVNGEPAPIKEVETNRWDALTVTDLRVELQNRDLLLSGKKAELIARLLEHDSPVIEEVVEEEDIEGDVVNDESE
tara:strand:+ start:178 stop:543 length:366 start_codon:yes stop_codon:yes gene_type:complete